jgi:GT2 family glycosyltransferase
LIAAATPAAGILAPKIYYACDSCRIWSVGGKCHPLTIEKTNDGRGELDRGQWNTVLERDYFTGCAMLLSRELLMQVGLFDEAFFMYYEDSDLCRRARIAGFRLLLVPEARVWHKISRSSGGSNSPNERYWMARSSVRFFRKHVQGVRWLIVVPYRTGSALKTVLRLLWYRRHKSAWAYLTGLYHGLMETR